MSPLTYADRIRTPLLIQHSERDIRTTVGQAEALFTVLRTLRRPVRLLRVPEETHELTRSGTPFRRVENLRMRPRLVPATSSSRASAACRHCPKAHRPDGAVAAAGSERQRPGYPPRPMAVRQAPDTLSRERASELVSAWAGGRAGRPLGSSSGGSPRSTRSASRRASMRSRSGRSRRPRSCGPSTSRSG